MVQIEARVIGIKLNQNYEPPVVDVTLSYKVGNGDDFERMTFSLSQAQAAQFEVGSVIPIRIGSN